MNILILCDKLGYKPQSHGFEIIDDKLQILDNLEYRDVILNDLLTCKYFVEHLFLYYNSTQIYRDNYGNFYTREDGFFFPDEIDRRVKMGDLFPITK